MHDVRWEEAGELILAVSRAETDAWLVWLVMLGVRGSSPLFQTMCKTAFSAGMAMSVKLQSAFSKSGSSYCTEKSPSSSSFSLSWINSCSTVSGWHTKKTFYTQNNHTLTHTFIVHTITFNAVDMRWGLPSTIQRLGIQFVAGSHSSPQDLGFQHLDSECQQLCQTCSVPLTRRRTLWLQKTRSQSWWQCSKVC